MTDPADVYRAIETEVETVLIGNEDVVEGLTVAALVRGHVLLEGVPGVAKTTVANLFARTTGLEYSRVQMTPDILPADITGTSVYREGTGEFELRRGPVFSNVVVADEINRATAKTQSALLEAMQEGTVTIDGDTLELPDPFLVIATQNPIEMEGTFELPEAQRDRFDLKLRMELPDRDEESALVDRFDDDPQLGPGSVDQVVSREDLLAAREAVDDVHVSEAVREYILDLVAASRDSADVAHGASPRATIAFLNVGKARAAIQGRDYVTPGDVKRFVEPVLAHRLVLNTEADLGGVTTMDVVEDVLTTVEPPSRETASADAAAVSDGGEPDGGADAGRDPGEAADPGGTDGSDSTE